MPFSGGVFGLAFAARCERTGFVGILTTKHEETLTAVAYSPDGKHLATGDSGRYVKSGGYEGTVVRMYRFP